MGDSDTPAPDPRASAARLQDDALLDLLQQVRQEVGGLRPEEARGYEAALSSLEAEAAARGLDQPGTRERRPVPTARRWLARRLRTADADELLTVVPDLDPRGLYAIFRHALGRLPAQDRLRLLEALFTRLDDLHFDPPAAHRRRRRYLKPELPLERRIERLTKAVAFQFRTLHRLG